MKTKVITTSLGLAFGAGNPVTRRCNPAVDGVQAIITVLSLINP